MIVNFYSTLREIVGDKTVEFDLPAGITVFQLVEEIIRQYPLMERELVDNEGNLYQHVHVFVNGRDVPFLDNRVDTQLSAGDRISIFPAVGGGFCLGSG
jgi:molybdopterin synthase sulfur carrier subunit